MRNLLVVLTICTLFIGCTGTQPADLGIMDGHLKDCPESPNCISTMSPENDEEHYMQPIVYSGSVKDNMEKLKTIINSLERTNIVEEKNTYLWVEFTTPTLRFVDDVEFYFDDQNMLLHFRSASRLGHSDLGLNRKRMTLIKERYTSQSLN